ncbi:hypothetical protein [Streptomyces sp. NPDC002133]|uniref:hypothetical protein n=1 Tax=Streptomyces sp. NPDC002133 TaxID=3154409 RepID=UPI00332B1D28
MRNRTRVFTDVTRSALASDDPTRAADAPPTHLVAVISVDSDARDEELRVVWGAGAGDRDRQP